MVIAYSQTTVELREVVLKDKPVELINISPKATVPVLQLVNGDILEESLDIMDWALRNHDPQYIHLSNPDDMYQNELILENDHVFKKHLDQYKYADRFPEHDEIYYRQKGELFLNKLDNILKNRAFLLSNQLSVVDLAIFPFIRQFAHVNKTWFDQSNYMHLHKWLTNFLSSPMFVSVMHKFSQWKNGSECVVFPVSETSNKTWHR